MLNRIIPALRFLTTAAAIGAAATLPGCYSPGGTLMNHTGAAHTYVSTASMQKTVEIVDTRDGSVIFSIDIPVDQQLTMQFLEDEGDDPDQRPDLMRYQIFPAGTSSGSLLNAMTVPAANAMRVDVRVRQGPAYAAGSPDRALRTDEMADRPAWWTPEGGPMPDDTNGRSNYDH
jgi:hypothetical protein